MYSSLQKVAWSEKKTVDLYIIEMSVEDAENLLEDIDNKIRKWKKIICLLKELVLYPVK
jgi:hypothetical protein